MSTSTEQGYSAVTDVAERHRETVNDADELLREVVQTDRQLSYAERTFLSRELGWDERKQNEERRRMHNVVRLQAIAGTSADREAMVTKAEADATLHKTEAPKLVAKIEKLQQQLDSLERDTRLSAKRVAEQRDAVSKLRELTPEHIAGSVRAEISTIEQTIGRELRDAETRINELRCCLTPSLYPSEAAYLEVVERSFRPAVLRGAQNRVIKRALSPAWPEIKAGIESELSELQARLVDLNAEYSEAIAAAEAPLNYYSR